MEERTVDRTVTQPELEEFFARLADPTPYPGDDEPWDNTPPANTPQTSYQPEPAYYAQPAHQLQQPAQHQPQPSRPAKPGALDTRNLLNPVKLPPKKGWRKLVYSATGGLSLIHI